MQSGALVVPLIGHRNAVTTAAFSPDGNWIVTGSTDGTARTWTTENGNQRSILAGHRAAVRSGVFASPGTVLTVGDDGTARLWDAGTEPRAPACRPERGEGCRRACAASSRPPTVS